MFSNKSSAVLFQTIISSLLGYISLFFINRYVGTVYWGYLSYAIAFGGLFSIVTDFGFNTAHLKFISGESDKREDMGTYLLIKIVLNVIYIGLVVGSLLFWTYALRRGFQNPIEFWAIISIIPYFSFINMIPFFNSYFRSTMQSYKIAVPRLIESVFRNGIFIVIGVIYFLGREGTIGASITVLLALIYGLAYFIYMFILYLFGRPWDIGKASMTSIKKYIKFALPLAFATSLGIVNGNIDKIIVQFFWGAVATGALYTDQKLVSIIGSLLGPISMFILPMLVRDLGDDKLVRDKKIIEYERIMSLISAPFALIFFFLSPFILNLYNGRYLMYATSLSIISVGTYIGAITGPFSTAIIARGRQQLVAWISMVGIFVNIALNIILIPTELFGIRLGSLGVEGATISFTVSALVVYILYKEIYRRVNDTRTRSVTLKHIFISLPTGIILLLSAVYIKPYSFVLLFPIILSVLLIYTGMSIAFNEISIKQIKEIISNLIPRKNN